MRADCGLISSLLTSAHALRSKRVRDLASVQNFDIDEDNKENYNNHHANMTKFQVKIAVNAEQEQRWVFEQVRADRRCWAWSEERQE